MDTRSRLKEAAHALFLEQGYGATTIAQIENDAGLAPRAGGFYRHFPSKEALLVAIAREDVIERTDEFELDALLPLGDTRAELMLIARTYLRANDRQRKYFDLIQETRKIPAIAEFVEGANAELFDWFKKWLGKKRGAAHLRGSALGAFGLVMFGGLGFFLTKRLEGVAFPGVTDETMIAQWADYWADVLDRPVRR